MLATVLDAGGDTKIVPVLSVGQGQFIGIVQAADPKEAFQSIPALARLGTRAAD